MCQRLFSRGGCRGEEDGRCACPRSSQSGPRGEKIRLRIFPMGVEQEAPPPRQITRAEGRQGQSARASEGDRDTGLGPESRDVSQLSGPPLPRVRLGDQACSSRRPWERSTKGGVGFKVGGTPSGGRARGLCQGGPGQPEGPCWRGTTIAKGQQDWSRAAPACWFSRPAPHGCLPVYCPSPRTRSRAPGVGGQPWVPSA